MNLRRKLVFLSVGITAASLLVGTVAVANINGDGVPFQEIWEAIFGIQEDMEDLQDQIDLQAQIAELQFDISELQAQMAFLEDPWIQGPAGPQGEKGDKGDTGPPGLGFGTTGTISVPAAQFVRRLDDDFIINKGVAMENRDETYYKQLYAGVQLPHGATITEITFYWYDSGTSYISCWLARIHSSTFEMMATVTSSGAGGWGDSSTSTITFPVVDNSQYAYYLTVELPPAEGLMPVYMFYYALIEYEYL